MTGTAAASDRSRARYLVWGIALAAYVGAVMHRTSFGVVGTEAIERFDVGAAVLSTFVVVQLAVYALAQIPSGVLLDRFGSRALLTCGALIMAAGQLALAVASSVGPVIAARIAIGAGDAMTFISVVRLIPAWFPARQVPLLNQLTGITGQLGQVLSAVPLVVVLHRWGWPVAFTAMAAVGLLLAALVVIMVADAPPGATVRRGTRGPTLRSIGVVVRSPGNWLGFWTHWVTQFSANVFMLLWGFPFLVAGQGLLPQRASALFTLNVAATIVGGLVLGTLSGRYPHRRVRLAAVTAVAIAVAWAVVLLPSGPRPLWVLAAFVCVLGAGGPASLIGFDIARSVTEPEHLGTATGFVNAAGFIAALTSMLAVGVLLDRLSPPGTTAYSLDAFRGALSVQAVPWAVGIVGLFVCWRIVTKPLSNPGDTGRGTPGERG